MAVLNTLLLVITLVVLVLVALVILVVLLRIRAAATRAQDAVGELGAALDRVLGAARTVKANGAEARETARVGDAAERAYRAGVIQAGYSELSIQVSFLHGVQLHRTGSGVPRSSACPARARPRCSRCSPGSTTCKPGGSCSTAATS